MKKDIHPKYYDNCVVTCSCGSVVTVGSTLPEMKVEICSKCHPFYTGQQKFVDTQGRMKSFSARQGKKKEEEAPAPKAETPKKKEKEEVKEAPRPKATLKVAEEETEAPEVESPAIEIAEEAPEVEEVHTAPTEDAATDEIAEEAEAAADAEDKVA